VTASLLRAATAAVRALRRRPIEATTALVVAGLVAGPRWPALVPVLALGAVAAGGVLRGLGPVLAVAVLAGATVADARLAHLDRSALGPSTGHAAVGEATLLEPLRRQAFGRRAAVVS